MVMQHNNSMAVRLLRQAVIQPDKLIITQFAVRHTLNLTVEQQDLPVFTNQHAFCR